MACVCIHNIRMLGFQRVRSFGTNLARETQQQIFIKTDFVRLKNDIGLTEQQRIVSCRDNRRCFEPDLERAPQHTSNVSRL